MKSPLFAIGRSEEKPNLCCDAEGDSEQVAEGLAGLRLRRDGGGVGVVPADPVDGDGGGEYMAGGDVTINFPEFLRVIKICPGSSVPGDKI